MSEGIQIPISAEDEASRTISNVRNEVQGLGASAGGVGDNFGAMNEQVGQSNTNLVGVAATAGVAAVAFMAFNQVREIIGGVRDRIVELNSELGEFQQEAVRLENFVDRMSSSSVAAQRNLEGMGDQVDDMMRRTGTPISQLNSLMGDLTLRFGDAEVAADNFERAMNLVELSGGSATQAARALSDAEAGRFQLLVRMGAMTREQAEDLQNMGDQAAAAAEAISIIDANTQGLIDTTPLAVEASDRLEASWERLRVSGAELLGVDRIMDSIARRAESLADSFESVTDAWTNGARSIREEMEGVNRATEELNETIDRTDQEREMLAYENAVANVNFELDQQLRTWGQIREARGDFFAQNGQHVDVAHQMAAIEEEREKRLADLEARYIRQRVELEGQLEFRKGQLDIDRQIIDAASEEERIRLETNRQTNELLRERGQQLNEIIDENGQITDTLKEQIIEQEFMNGLIQIQAEAEERVTRERERQNRESERAAEEVRQRRDRVALMELDLQIINAATQEERDRLEVERATLSIKQRSLHSSEESAAIELEMARIAEDRERRESRAARAAQERAVEDANRLDLARADLQILTEVDELEVSRLQRNRDLVELKHRDLEGEEQLIELQRIQAEHEQRQAAIQSSRREEELRIQQEMHSERMQNMRDEHAAQRELAGLIADAFSQADTDQGRALSSLTQGIVSVRQEYEELIASGVAAEEALTSSVSAGGQAVGSFFENMGLGVREVAGIRAGFEAAAALSAGASGNIPGAIGHGAAAAAFTATAAGAGQGASSGVASSAGASGGRALSEGGAIDSRAQDQASDSLRRAFVEAWEETQSMGTQATTIIDQRGAYLLGQDQVGRRDATAALSVDEATEIGGGGL